MPATSTTRLHSAGVSWERTILQGGEWRAAAGEVRQVSWETEEAVASVLAQRNAAFTDLGSGSAFGQPTRGGCRKTHPCRPRCGTAAQQPHNSMGCCPARRGAPRPRSARNEASRRCFERESQAAERPEPLTGTPASPAGWLAECETATEVPGRWQPRVDLPNGLQATKSRRTASLGEVACRAQHTERPALPHAPSNQHTSSTSSSQRLGTARDSSRCLASQLNPGHAGGSRAPSNRSLGDAAVAGTCAVAPPPAAAPPPPCEAAAAAGSPFPWEGLLHLILPQLRDHSAHSAVRLVSHEWRAAADLAWRRGAVRAGSDAPPPRCLAHLRELCLAEFPGATPCSLGSQPLPALRSLELAAPLGSQAQAPQWLWALTQLERLVLHDILPPHGSLQCVAALTRLTRLCVSATDSSPHSRTAVCGVQHLAALRGLQVMQAVGCCSRWRPARPALASLELMPCHECRAPLDALRHPPPPSAT